MSCHRNYANRIFLQKHIFRLIDRSLLPLDPCHELFCFFGNFYASRMQDAEVTKSLGEALPERGTFSRLQVYERVGKYVISVCIKTQKG